MIKFILLIFITYPLFAQNPSMSEDPNVKKTIFVFNELRSDNTEILDDYYASDVIFHDPVGSIKSLNKMKRYYQNMYNGVENIRFDFRNYAKQGEVYYFSWIMFLKTPKLNDGKEFPVTGVSQIHFKDGLVYFHRDYFDLGEMVYERIPIVGWLTKK